jgi:hypothetical protein
MFGNAGQPCGRRKEKEPKPIRRKREARPGASRIGGRPPASAQRFIAAVQTASSPAPIASKIARPPRGTSAACLSRRSIAAPWPWSRPNRYASRMMIRPLVPKG